MKRATMVRLVGAGIAGCARPARAQTAPATVRWGLLPGEESALPYYAQQMGFFEKAGIDVELSTFRDGGSVTQGVVSGALDLGVTNTGSMCLAHAHGLPLTLVQCGAVYSAGAPIAHLAVLKDSPIRSAAALSGKTIAISTLHDMMQAIVMNWIDENGGDSRAVNFTEIPVVAQAQAVIAGRVDAASIVEPAFSRARDDLRVLSLPYSSCSNGRPFQTLGFIGNRDWVLRNAGLAQRIAATLRTTARAINRHPRDVTPMLVAYAKLAPSVVAMYPRIRFAESNDPALLQPVIDLLTKYAYLAQAFPATDLFAESPSVTRRQTSS